MDLVRWKQQELAQRATRPVASVTTLDGYIGLWRLRRDVATTLHSTTNLTERLELQQMLVTVDQEIDAAKADPALAAQIHAWWAARYPPPPLKGRNR